jgi:hypothetical protein
LKPGEKIYRYNIVTRYKILNDLDDLLLPYTIDLSIFDDISDPDVIENIQRVGVIFYDKAMIEYRVK